MMPPELRFIKDFDSFNVEADFLEIFYGANVFRFGYASTDERRKFSFTSFGKAKVTLPEMLLQYQDEGVWKAMIVNFSMEFEDLLKLAQFVQKLAQVVGYQQMPVDKSDLSTNMPSDSESDDDDDDDCELKQIEMTSTRPIVVFIEDAGQPLTITMAAGGFDIEHRQSGSCYRFAHDPLIANRTYEFEPSGFGRKPHGRARYFVKNIILQGPRDQNRWLEAFPPRAGPSVGVGGYVDLAEVDLFVDFTNARGSAHFGLMLDQNGYSQTN